MKWADVAKYVADAAPIMGKLLPIPGAGVAGALIAAEFGTKAEPQAVFNKIKKDSTAAVRLAEIEKNNREMLQDQLLHAETARLKSINKTMVAEAKSEHWPQYSWRPFWGFASGLAFLAVSILVCFLAYKAVLSGNMGAMSMVPALLGAFAAMFAIPGGILGIAAHHRGREKRAIAEGGRRESGR